MLLPLRLLCARAADEWKVFLFLRVCVWMVFRVGATRSVALLRPQIGMDGIEYVGISFETE